MNEIIEKDKVESMIYEIRGVQVMLDSDLARLYQVETRRINEAVVRNPQKFPENFSWTLSKIDYDFLRSQFATLEKTGKGQHSKYLPRVFTEQGVYMLATILKSNVATQVSITIMNTFVKMRNYIYSNQNMLPNRLLMLEDKVDENTKRIDELFSKFTSKDNSIIYENTIYDSYSLLIDIFNRSNKEIIIVDNYANKELLDTLKNINKNITIISSNLDNILINKYSKQYNNIRFINYNLFHDRYIILDNKEVYISGMSLKDIGKKYSYIYKMNEEVIIKELLERINEVTGGIINE